MSKMNALAMLKMIFMITHKKHCSMSALSEHKLFIFKSLIYYTISIKKYIFSKFTEYIVEYLTDMGLRS